MVDSKINNCSLCNPSDKFYITFCWAHPDHILIISTEHKTQFSEEEKAIIRRLFPNNEICWEMKSMPQHSHCHIIPKEDKK